MQEQKVQPSKREWKRGELYMVYTHILYSPWGRKESDMTEQLSLSYIVFTTGFPSGSLVKTLPTVQEMQETCIRSLDQEDPLEEGMATHCSILAWRIPMDRGAWLATVHGVTKSWTQLSD